MSRKTTGAKAGDEMRNARYAGACGWWRAARCRRPRDTQTGPPENGAFKGQSSIAMYACLVTPWQLIRWWFWHVNGAPALAFPHVPLLLRNYREPGPVQTEQWGMNWEKDRRESAVHHHHHHHLPATRSRAQRISHGRKNFRRIVQNQGENLTGTFPVKTLLNFASINFIWREGGGGRKLLSFLTTCYHYPHYPHYLQCNYHFQALWAMKNVWLVPWRFAV